MVFHLATLERAISSRGSFFQTLLIPSWSFGLPFLTGKDLFFEPYAPSPQPPPPLSSPHKANNEMCPTISPSHPSPSPPAFWIRETGLTLFDPFFFRIVHTRGTILWYLSYYPPGCPGGRPPISPHVLFEAMGDSPPPLSLFFL